MTVIVEGVATKKALRDYAARVPFDGAKGVEFNDPSLFTPIHGGGKFRLTDMHEGDSFVCTNHPKRSFFAKVERLGVHKWRIS